MIIKLRDWNPQKKTQELIEIILKQVKKFNIALTVRQVHYILVETPEANHKNTIGAYQKASRILTKMRYAGLLSWDKITDETRGVYKTTSYEDIDKALEGLLKKYRRDRWKDSEYYVEVWTEKRTLVNQFYQVTDKYDVFLASGGGFSSATYIYEAVDRIIQKQLQHKKIIILYFGDLDPSGDFMDEDIEKRFEEWNINLTFKRIALKEEHLQQFNLKKRFDVPVKKGEKIYNKIKADPRAKNFYEKYGELFQVELEALDPNILNSMLENSILEYVDTKQHDKVKEEENAEVEQVEKKLWKKEQLKKEGGDNET